MAGLIKNNFYSILGNLKLFLGFFFIMAVGFFITGNAILFICLYVIVGLGMALISVSGLGKEAASKWSMYKLSFPVKRKEIVKSFYVSHGVWTLLDVFLTMIVFALAVLFHGNQYFDLGLRDAIVLLTASGVVALMVGAIYCPLFHFWGADKAEILMVLSLAGAVGFMALTSWIVNSVNGYENVSDFRLYMGLLFVWVTAIIMFLFSYLLTSTLFQKLQME
ncbi:MAG: ABC-2 transporter permease [Lachnospiraceae bacterium]|nr:ABC-2 transporter permease [Lachnospiraceae bacterium]